MEIRTFRKITKDNTVHEWSEMVVSSQELGIISDALEKYAARPKLRFDARAAAVEMRCAIRDCEVNESREL